MISVQLRVYNRCEVELVRSSVEGYRMHVLTFVKIIEVRSQTVFPNLLVVIYQVMYTNQ